jgi:2-dehydropantoate 2-reductase
MMVTIAGCGALGSLLAARLVAGGERVQVFQRAGAQLEALRERGITVEADRGGIDSNYRLDAVSCDTAELSPSRLIIVLVKSYNSADILPVGNLLAADGVVLSLQNGLGNAETLSRCFGEDRVAAGVATYGAYRTAPGVIHWGGDGFITFGPWKRGSDFSWVGARLRRAGLNAAYAEDPRPAIWKKLAINAMVNTSAALTRLNNGELLDSPPALNLMKKLAAETMVAARRAGVDLDFEELWAMHLENLERTAANKPSMLQDVEAGRQTETDAISGGVLGYARDEEDFPYTRALHALLKAIDLKRAG